MEKHDNIEIDYNFLEEVIKEYRELEPNGKIFVNIGNERKVIRAVSNTHINVTVTSEEEKEALHKKFLLEKTRNEKSKYPPKRISNLTQEMNKENVTTRDGIKIVQNNKSKKNVKENPKVIKNKKYTLSEKMKEFLKRNGMKIGVGITALALTGVITSATLNERAENIDRFNDEFTSIEQVEEKIKGIIDAEIEGAVVDSGLQTDKKLDIDISGLNADGELAEGIEIVIRGLNVNYDKKMVIQDRKGFDGGNIPESLVEMANNYLDVASIGSDGKEIKDSVKAKAIRALKKVENIAAKKMLKIKETSKFIVGNDYQIKEAREIKHSDEGFDR